MSSLREAAGRMQGLIGHAGGAAALFLGWRFFGLPSPGLEGRLIPLCWLLAGAVAPGARFSKAAAGALLGSVLCFAFWRAGPAVTMAARVLPVAGLFPAMIHSARYRAGLLLSAVPVAPLVILLVPFTGDEPTNAALAQSIIVDHDLDTSNNMRQMDRWSPVRLEIADQPGLSHHMPLFAVLISPGLPFGAAGIRAVCILLSVAAGYAFLALLRKARAPDPSLWALAGLLLLPGAGVFGLAYPDMTAAGLLAAGALLSRGRNGFVAACAVTLLLAALKLRFAPAGVGLMVSTVLERSRRGRLMLSAGAVLLLAAVLSADHFLLGGRLFWLRYGNVEALRLISYRTFDSLPSMAAAPFWMLFDSEAGLVWRAPWVLLAPAGYAAFRARAPQVSRSLLLASVLYIVTILLWLPDTWHSMPTASGRLFVPLLPLLAACAAFAGRGGRPLLLLSAMPSAFALSMPILRFNLFDGIDRVFDQLGPSLAQTLAGAFPAMLRPDALQAVCWAASGAVLIILAYGGRRTATVGFAAACLVAAGALAPRLRPLSWEAESLPPDYRLGCSQYPGSVDPTERMAWPGSQEPLLRLSTEDDAVLLPVPPGRDSIRVEVSIRAVSDGDPARMEIICGAADTSIAVPARLAPVPGWLTAVRHGRIQRREVPEAVAETTLVVRLPARGMLLALRCGRPLPTGPLEGIYLDRIRIY